MDWRHIGELLAAGRAVFTEIKNLCVWNKTNGGTAMIDYLLQLSDNSESIAGQDDLSLFRRANGDTRLLTRAALQTSVADTNANDISRRCLACPAATRRSRSS